MSDIPAQSPTTLRLHATAVSDHVNALLIVGPSGSGKSSLALELLALGGALVADDRCEIVRIGDELIVSRPPELPPKIEARGVGLLEPELSLPCAIAAIVDLSEHEQERLPPNRTRALLGVESPLFHKSSNRAFPSALWLYLKRVSNKS